jgi:hypothetical protein
MAKSPAHIISDFLATRGLGILPPNTVPAGEWRIRTGRQGEGDQQITVYDTGGTAAHPVLRLDYPSIQVRVRGAPDDYPGAYSKINDIKECLLGLESIDLDSLRWDAINMIGGVVHIGYDDHSRPEFTVNFRCIVEPAADSSAFMHRESL